MNNKLLSLLGFARKAGKLSIGAAATKGSILCKKAKLVVISGEISQKSQKEIIFHADKYKVKTLLLEDIDIITLSNAVGIKCGIVSVNDSSFAEALMKTRNTGGNV